LAEKSNHTKYTQEKSDGNTYSSVEDANELSDNSEILDEYKAGTIQEMQVSKNNRNHIDSSMYNTLGRMITIKVYSHRLHNAYTAKHPTEQPSLELIQAQCHKYFIKYIIPPFHHSGLFFV
jgi:hypothetical protein